MRKNHRFSSSTTLEEELRCSGCEMLRISFTLIVILAVAFTAAEEIETRKTVKKASAVDAKDLDDPITDSAERQTIQIEVIKETTPSASTAVVTQESTTEKSTTLIEEPTTKAAVESTTVAEVISSTSEIVSSVSEISQVPEVDSTYESPDSEEDSSPDLNNILPLSETPKRKVIYINQQQNGKLNVHLDLSDVSVIVIPNKNDPQLSLLNLLFKSAQKSNSRNEAKKKEEIANTVDHHDEYSKYKQSVRVSDETFSLGSPNMPLVESRIPYKVDISSTLGQHSQPAVEIMPNSHHHLSPSAGEQFQPQFARAPIMQLLKPLPYAIHAAAGQKPQSNHRIFKRSIDSRLFRVDTEIPNGGENSVNYDDDGLTESIFNSLYSEEDLNAYDHQDESEFILLGASENCGPGRKRNSYQICVSVADMK